MKSSIDWAWRPANGLVAVLWRGLLLLAAFAALPGWAQAPSADPYSKAPKNFRQVNVAAKANIKNIKPVLFTVPSTVITSV